eukprot:TRINITY_DN942_c0_g1_i2.p1 TRINITY_DN942_c0_g1~~TRINITY_DN942_c0_g1_i2.p1  ORF type:complete len:129 (-),score=42.23 TRINITY_DN942_c0_g1_i2:20-406(-)
MEEEDWNFNLNIDTNLQYPENFKVIELNVDEEKIFGRKDFTWLTTKDENEISLSNYISRNTCSIQCNLTANPCIFLQNNGSQALKLLNGLLEPGDITTLQDGQAFYIFKDDLNVTLGYPNYIFNNYYN